MAFEYAESNMLTRQGKQDLKTKASNLKKSESSFRKQYGRSESNDEISESDESHHGYGYFQLGFEFAISILIFLLGGYHLDKAVSTSPLFLFLGLVIGFSIGLYRLVSATKHDS